MKFKQKIAIGYLRANLKLLAVISKKLAVKKALRLFCTPFGNKHYKSSPTFNQAEKLQLYVDNKKITGHRWQHPRPKKFLIVHGFQSTARKFENYITPMINKGYEVLAFDAPAHGESEGKQVTVLDYKKLIRKVVEDYGPIDAFMAHSFGGLALGLALEDITHTIDTRVVLIAPATETTTAVDMLFRELHMKPALRKHFNDLIFKVGDVTVEWLSITRAIKNIHASILWIHDEEDDITPLKDVLPLIEHGYSNIRFMITRGWGHRQIYRERTVIDAVTSFL